VIELSFVRFAEAEIIGTGVIKRLDNRECEMARMLVASTY
jgi:hypothetical protein